jgi:hypothetical protein
MHFGDESWRDGGHAFLAVSMLSQTSAEKLKIATEEFETNKNERKLKISI